MNKAIFPAFKFLSLDYAFENVMKQKLAISWMRIPFPNEILQEEDFHTKLFVNDTYRRPWKISVPTCQIQEEGLLIDMWKTCTSCTYTSFDDFLERKEEALAIVPSSNPCSQIDLADVCSVIQSCTAEASHTDKSWKNIPSSVIEDNLLPGEVIFVDCLSQFRQHLPSLSSLIKRLKTIPVQDPLPKWKETFPTKELLFRMDTSLEKNLEPDFLLEEFHYLLQNREEHLILSSTMEINERAKNQRSSASCLITVLQLAPEKILDASSEGLLTQISAKQEIIERTSIVTNSDLTKCEDVVEKVFFSSYHEEELEVPFSPPQRAQKDAGKEQCSDLVQEALSPICSIFHIIDLPTDISEFPESHAEIQFPVLKVSSIPAISPHHTIEQLMEKVCITSDNLEDFILEYNWQNKFGLTLKHDTIIETLNCFLNSTTSSPVSKSMESVTRITPVQLEQMLKDKQAYMENKEDFQKTDIQFISQGSATSKISVSCPPLHRQINVAFHIDSQETNETLVTHKENQQLDTVLTFPKGQDVKENTPSVTEVLPVGHEIISHTNFKDISEAQTWQDIGSNEPGTMEKNDIDPLSSFIILRTKRSLAQSGEKYTSYDPAEVSDAEKRKPEQSVSQGLSSDVGRPQERTEQSQKQNLSVHFTALESQCQAYRVLQAAAVPILNKLTSLGVSTCAKWKFASVSFDSTRFLLCQQEKTITNRRKLGAKSNKEMILFKNASFLHILVTLRDLILMCTLEAAIEYLCNAKSMYNSVLESLLNDVWKKLRIIQYVKDKTKEANPKITALLQWMEETYPEQKLLKILIISRMHSEAIKESLNNSTEKTKGLKSIAIYPVSGKKFLDPKHVLDSLRNYSYIIANNQYIGSDFPWAHFSLVIEYDCTDVWLKLCQDLNVPHVTLKSQFPDPSIMETSTYCDKELLLHIQIPYVFLSSEGLTNYPEILHLLESRYNMTFIERECSPPLQLFGKADHCALITVDDSTVIILQSLEELMPDKSAENLILKLMALSLQYSCCWVLLYAKETLNTEYNLSEMTLHNVALVYAAITAYLSKSEDLQIKTFISPGIDKTGLLVRHIADHTLMFSESDPYEWLDKSWLFILLSEEEKVLLSFPSINPMMAQRMLSRKSSLQWLLSATQDQLKKRFPEMPSKVVKHFCDITALHKLSKRATSQRPFDISVPAAIEKCYSPDNIQNSPLAIHKGNSCSAFVSNKTQLVHNGLLEKYEIMISNSTKSSQEFEAAKYWQNTCIRDNKCVKQTQLSSKVSTLQSFSNLPQQSMRFSNKYYLETTFLDCSGNQNRRALSENVSEQHSHQSTDAHEGSPDMSPDEEHGISQHNYYGKTSMSSFLMNKKDFFADLSSQKNPTNPACGRNELEDPKCGLGNIPSHALSVPSEEHLDDLQFSQMSVAAKRRCTINNILTQETILTTGTTFSQPPKQKRRKLICEKVPGRSDGQTRLKFFYN